MAIPTQDDIVVKNDERLITILVDALFSCQDIPFIALIMKDPVKR